VILLLLIEPAPPLSGFTSLQPTTPCPFPLTKRGAFFFFPTRHRLRRSPVFSLTRPPPPWTTSFFFCLRTRPYPPLRFGPVTRRSLPSCPRHSRSLSFFVPFPKKLIPPPCRLPHYDPIAKPELFLSPSPSRGLKLAYLFSPNHEGPIAFPRQSHSERTRFRFTTSC